MGGLAVMKFGTAEDRDNYLIRFCVAELEAPRED